MLNIERIWYSDKKGFFVYLLLPFSWLFHLITVLRRLCYRCGIFKTYHFKTPVIVIGNLTVGGNGKTPFTIWLANFLKSKGYHPGLVSRGYGGKGHAVPMKVERNADAKVVGDEALLLVRHTELPLYISANRVAAVKALLANEKCDIVIADDGLQHYRLGRHIEIVLVDGVRRFGNQCLLPAGPLREPISRSNEADFVVKNNHLAINQWDMALMPEQLISLTSKQMLSLKDLPTKKVHAVAAIGNPDRFFDMLKKEGLEVIAHPFPDHYRYQSTDFQFNDQYPILMTEKDAVKCEGFADSRFWYLSVSTKIGDALQQALISRLQATRGAE